MSETKRCKAKPDGQQCPNEAETADFCRDHYPKLPPSRFREAAKTASEVIKAAGGAVVLIETIIRIWQHLPFGPGLQMPDDYNYLAGKIEFSRWSKRPRMIRVFTKHENTVNWRQARAIYDKSLAILEQPASGRAATEAQMITEIEASITSLLDDLQDPFREMLLYELGDLPKSEEAR